MEDSDIEAVERIANSVYDGSTEEVAVEQSDSTTIMVEITSASDLHKFDAGRLEPFLAEGYVATSVGTSMAWFTPIEHIISTEVDMDVECVYL
jgi:hypothetical protein